MLYAAERTNCIKYTFLNLLNILLGFRQTVSEEELLKEKNKHLHYEKHQGMTVVSKPAAGFLWCQVKPSILFFLAFPIFL